MMSLELNFDVEAWVDLTTFATIALLDPSGGVLYEMPYTPTNGPVCFPGGAVHGTVHGFLLRNSVSGDELGGYLDTPLKAFGDPMALARAFSSPTPNPRTPEPRTLRGRLE